MNIDELLQVMARLRDPEQGCPWDREQNFHTIYPYTIEEAYEVADAIERGDMAELRDELGDLLFQVAFHSRMAEESGHFEFADVVASIVDKMVRRHPHVFSDSTIADAEAQTEAWEKHKAAERRAKAGTELPSHLDGVALGLPALLRGQKLQKRAAKAGFDWSEVSGVLDKVSEEIQELRDEMAQGGEPKRLEDEVGDLLFSCVNLARHLHIDAEQSMHQANRKFERRFRQMEQHAATEGKSLDAMQMSEMDALWQSVKQTEEM